MGKFEISIKRFNEKSILVEWPSLVDTDILEDVIAFKHQLSGRFYKVEMVSAYNSLLIVFPALVDFESISATISTLYNAPRLKATAVKRLWKIPVCYDNGFGIDMGEFAKAKSTTPQEIIKMHTSSAYTIYCIGFLPGFMYLGGLDKRLHQPRRSEPRLEIPQGSVGIGGEQTGVYPQSSPGGWNIIGNSPVKVFDVTKKNPCPLNVGDKVQFYSVEKARHELISLQVQAGVFKLESEVYHG